jgi:hypothetical protein
MLTTASMAACSWWASPGAPFLVQFGPASAAQTTMQMCSVHHIADAQWNSVFPCFTTMQMRSGTVSFHLSPHCTDAQWNSVFPIFTTLHRCTVEQCLLILISRRKPSPLCVCVCVCAPSVEITGLELPPKVRLFPCFFLAFNEERIPPRSCVHIILAGGAVPSCAFTLTKREGCLVLPVS